MKTVICTIARNEENYLKHFCEYHLDLGFDEIHIFNNGTDINFSNKNVIVYDYTNETKGSPQMKAYNDFIKRNDYDWCAFIDVDEFITLDENIKTFIKNIEIGIDGISLNEVVYGDDNKIFPDDITVPVYERIKTQSKIYQLSFNKFILKPNKELIWKNPHNVYKYNYIVNSNGEKYNKTDIEHKKENAILDNCYIRHYKTKTLSEFCNQKLNTPRVFRQSHIRTMDYYFKVNEKTQEKLDYIEKIQTILSRSF